MAGTEKGDGSGRSRQSPGVTVNGSHRTWICTSVAGSEPRLWTVILMGFGIPLAAPATARPNGPTELDVGALEVAVAGRRPDLQLRPVRFEVRHVHRRRRQGKASDRVEGQGEVVHPLGVASVSSSR